MSHRLYFPPAEAGEPRPLTIKLANQKILTFTYDAEQKNYTFTAGNNSEPAGRVNAQEWMKLNLLVKPGAGDTPQQQWANANITVRLSGELKSLDTSATSSTYTETLTGDLGYVAPTVDGTGFITAGWGSISTPRYSFAISGQEGDVSGFYLDDIRVYESSALALERVETEVYEGDIYGNIKVDGDIKLVFNHDINAEHFNTNMVHVASAEGTAVTPSAIVFDPSLPNCITLRFADSALDYYTNYEIMLDGSLTDVSGNVIDPEADSASFSTLGAANAMPTPMPLSTPPVGGYVMPDEYNTGYLSAYEDLAPVAEKYPELAGNKKTITDEIAKKYDYLFEGFQVTGDSEYFVVEADNVTFRDFYIKNKHYWAIDNKGLNFTAEDGEIEGTDGTTVTGDNVTLRRLYLHDVGADHLKPATNWLVESCYLRDGGTGNYLAHADGMQISGNADAWTNNIRILGNRIDMPALPLEHAANATLFCSLNFGGASNIEMRYNWLNGGGQMVYITNGGFDMAHVTFTDNQFGIGRRYGYLNGPSASIQNAVTAPNTELEAADVPSVGSVVYRNAAGARIHSLADADETMEILVNFANYTTREQNVTVVAELYKEDGTLVNQQPLTTSIPRYIPTSEYLDGPITEYQKLLAEGTEAEGLSDSKLTAKLNEIGESLQEKANTLNAREDLTIRALWKQSEAGPMAWFYELKAMPDLPRNVERTLTLSGLSGIVEGDYVKVSVYKGDASTGVLLRQDMLDFTGSSAVPLPPSYEPITALSINTPDNLEQTSDAIETVDFNVTPTPVEGINEGAIVWYVNDAIQEQTGKTFDFTPAAAGSYVVYAKAGEVESEKRTVTVTAVLGDDIPVWETNFDSIPLSSGAVDRWNRIYPPA